MNLVKRLQPFNWLAKPSDWIEVFSSLLAWCWGILLILPYDTFGSTLSYRTMAFLAPEESWGFLFILIALLHGLSLCAGFFELRVPACWLASFIWSFVGVLFAIANPQGIAPWLWLSLALLLAAAGGQNGYRR